MSDLTPQTSATTFRWLREVPARDEVIRIDAEGFHYLGQFIADAGEAYQLLVEFLRKHQRASVPVAWMYRGEPDFDGKKWRENWLVTLDRRVAEHGVRLGLPIPLFHAQIAPTPVPVGERLPGPEDCDAEGRCWVHQPHEACPESPAWELMLAKYASANYEAVCWLPAHALPLPEVAGTPAIVTN